MAERQSPKLITEVRFLYSLPSEAQTVRSVCAVSLKRLRSIWQSFRVTNTGRSHGLIGNSHGD